MPSGGVSPAAGGASPPIQSGSGTPVGTVTPTAKGYAYIDRASGAIWEATGTTNTSWVAVGGVADALRNGDGTYGVGISVAGHLLLVSSTSNAVEISTADGIANTGNGVAWHGADGGEIFELFQGSSRQYHHLWDTNGTYVNAHGIIFPAADPHVVGAWWDNGLTLVRSAG